MKQVSIEREGSTANCFHSPLRPDGKRNIAERLMSISFGAALLAVSLVLSPDDSAARGAPESFADLAESVTPAVVNISTKQKVQSGDRSIPLPQFPPGSPFEDFFKEFFDRNQQGQNRPRSVTSLGSGFIVDASGVVITNNHVIEGADEITVIMNDKTEYPAKLLGKDPRTDVAVLKIESKKPLPFVSIGDSDKARVGDWVMAVGNPFGLGGSVTAGIISARGRDINATDLDDFIQTDASINRGNSGGPLFNMAGEVIGINTAIYSPSGGSVGIGFSIPTAQAQKVIADIRQYGETRQGWLGVRIQTVTEEIAASLGLKQAEGALVAGVTPGGPAEKAGIEMSDVILEFDGAKVESMKTLPRIVANTEIGKTVNVVVWRNSKRLALKAKLGRFDEETIAKADGVNGPQGGAGSELLGLRLSELTPLLRQRFELPEDVAGVAVLDVESGGAAAETGIRPGDIIVEVDRKKVATPADVEKIVDGVRKGGRKAVLFLLRRGGENIHVAFPLEEKSGS